MNIRGILKAARGFTIKHGPEILTAVGTIGLIASGIMAVNQTPRAMEILREHEEELGTELTAQEKFKACWTATASCSLLTCCCWVATTPSWTICCCCLTSSSRSAAAAAAWAAAYQMSENALLRLENSVKDELGENKLKKIQDNATAKLIEENPVNPEEIINTGDGDDLFMDYYSKRYFRSCTKAINTRYNHFIARLQHEDYMTPNDWLYEMDLPRICPELGDCKYFTSAMYQSKLLDDEPEYTYGPGPFGAPCGIVKMSCEPSFERY